MASTLNKVDAEYMHLVGRITASPSVLRLTTASNGLPAALSSGIYRMVSDVDCYVRFSSGAMTVAVATNASYLPAGVVEYIPVADADSTNCVAISASTGYLYLTKLAD